MFGNECADMPICLSSKICYLCVQHLHRCPHSEWGEFFLKSLAKRKFLEFDRSVPIQIHRDEKKISRLLHKEPKLQKIVARTEVRSCWRIQFTHPVELQCLEFRGYGHRVTFEPPCMFFFSDATWRNLLKTCWCQKRHQKHGNDFASDFRVFLRRSEVTTKICRSGEKRELLPALQILKPLQHVRFPHFKGFLIPIPSLFQWFFYFCSHCEVKDLPEHFKCFFASTEARAMERMFVFQPFEGKQQISKRSLLCTSFTSFWNKDALETEWTNPKSKGSVLRF